MSDALTIVKPTEKLEGRVAQVLNARELVINIGSDKGVAVGMKFAVLSATPMVVHDPETNELLDSVDREKVRVEAVEVRPKIAICKTYRTTHTPAGSLYLGVNGFSARLADALAPPKVVTETLEAKDASLPPPLSADESYVKISDRVVRVEE